MQKKRQHKRLLVKIVGEIYRTEEDETQRVRLGDVGLGGVEVFSEKEFKKGERLKVKITVLAKKGKNLVGTFPGVIRWTRSHEDGFLAGVQFDQVIDKDSNFDFFSYIVESRDYFGSP